jgi:hypothetical protein
MVEVTKEEKLRVLLQDIRRSKDTLHSRTDTDVPLAVDIRRLASRT